VIEVPEAREGGASGRLVIDLDRSPIKEVFRGKLVAIDPGHGGSDIGGRGPVNLVEKKIALEIGRLLACALRREGAGVVMTRTSDEDVSKSGKIRPCRVLPC
jgi:N-acetylmuramoyl-L-alanine amidase